MRNSEQQREHYALALSAATTKLDSGTSADWLESDFVAPVWHCTFESGSDIDFRVRLEDGQLLTAAKHKRLEESFKRFLIAQTNLRFTGGVVYANNSLVGRILPAVHICEYLLMRTEELGLAKYGLGAISESTSYQMLRDLAQWECSESVYQWRQRLANLLRSRISELTDTEIALAMNHRPDILDGQHCQELEMDAETVGKSRVWLWNSGLYRLASADPGGSRFIVDSGKLTGMLYPRGTLKSTWKKRRFGQLELAHGPYLRRELEGIPVRGDKRSETPLRFYARALTALPLVQSAGFEVPSSLIRAAEDKGFQQSLPLESVRRYKTVPRDIVLSTLRSALEFSLEWADDILSAYVELITRCIKSGETPFEAGRCISQIASSALRENGLAYWSVSLEYRKGRSKGLSTSAKQIEKRFFDGLRANQGLFELMQVLWGALLICVGGIMARRQGEIMDLRANSYLDESRTRLKFYARKSGSVNEREELTRPIPSVLVKLLDKLSQTQATLIKLGAIDGYTNLFAFPSMKAVGYKDVSDENCNDLLDRACDYFKLPLDSKGRRYYLRQHQLRRFFPQLFLQANAAGGLDTLRWFLGHTDPEHLWRYIKEDTPGEVLRETQVDFVLDRLVARDPVTDDLAQALKDRFGATSIQLLDEDEIADYIDTLLKESKLTVEPRFFDGHSGREYTIVITVERPSE